MQWKLTFCAVTFEEICEAVYKNVAWRCFELMFKYSFPNFTCMQSDVLGALEGVV